MSKTKNSKLEKFMPYVLSVGMLTFVAACGSDDDDDDSSPGPSREEAQTVTYKATLLPLNNSQATGEAIVKRDGDNFTAEVTMDGAPVTVHMQEVRTGTACPTNTADANSDGFIDTTEASQASGQVLIPLDSDLSAQSGGSYPVGRSYDYSESTSWDTMVADLTEVVAPETDNGTGTSDDTTTETEVPETEVVVPEFAKITGPLILSGRVVQIHGTTQSLPSTVEGSYGDSPLRSFPIACGVLVLSNETNPTTTPTQPEETTPTETTPTETGTGTSTDTGTNTSTGTETPTTST